MALTLIRQHRQLQSSSIQPHELQYCHRWRRKRLELELQFSLDQESANKLLSFKNSRLQKCMAPSHGFDVSSRLLTTSLFMSQNSESPDDSENCDDNKKKGKDSDTSGNSPKSKANKSSNKDIVARSPSVAKGTSSKAKRRRNNKAKDKQQNKLTMNKGRIKTSDENTSLKGFKSKMIEPAPPSQTRQPQTGDSATDDGDESNGGGDIQKRVVQLEMIVSNQMAEIQKLRREIDDMSKQAAIFANVVNILREAGLRIDEDENIAVGGLMGDEIENEDGVTGGDNTPFQQQMIHDDMEIFGIAPKSVTDAADAAGASILSAILAGKQRMLVDVRDAELTRDPKLFVEFIELAILPVAAGLEGLDSDEYKHRVKIVFPTVKDLMSY